MQGVYVVSAITENTLRVLQRISGIFARHRINIQQLNVFEIENSGISHFSIVVQGNSKTVEVVVKKLQRIIEVLEVKISSQIPLIQSKG
jgi:acetolactate synthase I/III small subunit